MALSKAIRALIGLPALLLAACDDGPKTVSHFSRPELIPSMLTSASTKGPALVVIHGSPFPERDEVTQTVVLETMMRAVTWRKTAFTLNAAEASEPETRIIWAFGVADNLDARKLCRGETPPAASDDKKIKVRAVFCARDQLLSDVSGSIKTVAEPQDAMFDTLISQVTRTLLDKG